MLLPQNIENLVILLCQTSGGIRLCENICASSLLSFTVHFLVLFEIINFNFTFIPKKLLFILTMPLVLIKHACYKCGNST